MTNEEKIFTLIKLMKKVVDNNENYEFEETISKDFHIGLVEGSYIYISHHEDDIFGIDFEIYDNSKSIILTISKYNVDIDIDLLDMEMFQFVLSFGKMTSIMENLIYGIIIHYDRICSILNEYANVE